MTTPVVYGGIGMSGKGLGTMGLGGPQPARSYALPTMPPQARAYIGHLYDRNLNFKRLLGTVGVEASGILNKPDLKQTQNGGYQSVTLEVAAPISEDLPSLLLEDGSGALLLQDNSGAITAETDRYNIQLGDVIRLTEQGDPSGLILFTGNVETTPEAQTPSSESHQIVVAPWVTELGDGFFDMSYATAVDIAQWVRDAVATTPHCSVTPISCPDTGITGTNDFDKTNPLDAIHVAKQRAGADYWYFCDAEGIVWFQPVNTSNPPTLKIRKAQVEKRKPLASVAGMKNKIPMVGGQNPGDPGRIESTYDGLINQTAYGVKAFNPTLSFPNITDQPTLDGIRDVLGELYDRVLHTDEIDCPSLGVRLMLGRAGGITVQYWEPQVDPMIESSEPGVGVFGPTLILQDVECSGIRQKLFLGDVPFTEIDPAYEAARVAQRISTIGATAQPIPALTPLPAPATTTVYGKVKATAGIKAMGGGIVTIATATFSIGVAGTCQVVGAVDARMEAWDNYIAAPRRAVRATLSGGVFTGAWQELPFGLARANYDLSSASGLALAAGTYTVTIQIDTQEFNQMHIYSGYVQVAVTS